MTTFTKEDFDAFLPLINKLEETIEETTFDYLKDNGLYDYLTIGEGRDDIKAIEAINFLKSYIDHNLNSSGPTV